MNQQELIESLRLKVMALPKPVIKGDSKADDKWAIFRIMLRQNILNDDPQNFLHWGVILQTMFHFAHSIELEYLQKLPSWNIWKEALKEDKAGNPFPYNNMHESSGNLIHHAYSLAQLLEKMKCSINDFTQVIEFGGGYGSMCRLFYKLGFQGRYIIYDLSEFSALQEYFFNTIEIPSEIKEEPSTDPNCVLLFSDINKLIYQLKLSSEIKNTLFIALWSISETSMNFRQKIFDLVSEVSYYLIAYQKEFGEVDNNNFFEKYIKVKGGYEWVNYEINHLPGNRYLLGKQKV